MDIIDIFRKKPSFDSTGRKIPKHVALTVDGSFVYAGKNKEPLSEVFKKNYLNIKNVTKISVSKNIPVITFFLLPEYMSNESNFSNLMDSIAEIFIKLKEWEFLSLNQVKVTVFGKWYDLPERVVSPIKDMIDETKDYDNFFLNFCINYNGQEEIVDALRIIIRQAVAGKINPDSLSKQMVKENIYTSYFIPPDLIIKTGKVKSLKGFLLWDSMDSRIYFADKYWPEFTKQDYLNALDQIK